MNQRILTKRETQQRHKQMLCKSYELKIDKSHLIKELANHLRQLFLEAKWFTNYAIANGIFEVDYKIKTVQIKVKLKQLPMEHREAALLYQGRYACGEETSTRMLEYLNSIPYIRASFLYETGSLTDLA